MSASMQNGTVNVLLSFGRVVGSLLVIMLPFHRVTAASNGLDQVWKVQLRNLATTAPANWESYGVWRLSFSPDGIRLAIGFGDSSAEHEITRRILIVRTGDPTHVEATFNLPLRLIVPWGNRLSWSPDGQHLAVPDISARSFILDVHDGSYCAIEASDAVFLSSESILGKKWTLEGDALSVFTPKCAVKQGWQVHRGIRISDFSPAASSIAALRFYPDKHGEKNESVIIDAASLPDLRITATFSSDFYGGRFARQGTVQCASHGGGFTCWTVDNRREVKIPIEAGAPAEFEVGGNRLVVSEFKKHTMPHGLANALDLPSVRYTFQRRVVWDLERSQLIAAYTPQTVLVRRKGNQTLVRLFAYAISADGKYIADGGPDSVTLYRIR